MMKLLCFLPLRAAKGMIRVQEEDFNLGAEYQKFADALPTAGAIVAFVGRVRSIGESPDGKEPTKLINAMTLEHYDGMTQKELLSIELEARDRWSLEDTFIIHRYGRLEPGDQIVLVLTASRHRLDAFEAAQFLMDWLKTKAPFWKLEETPNGENWVQARSEDDEATDRWT